MTGNLIALDELTAFKWFSHCGFSHSIWDLLKHGAQTVLDACYKQAEQKSLHLYNSGNPLDAFYLQKS